MRRRTDPATNPPLNPQHQIRPRTKWKAKKKKGGGSISVVPAPFFLCSILTHDDQVNEQIVALEGTEGVSLSNDRLGVLSSNEPHGKAEKSQKNKRNQEKSVHLSGNLRWWDAAVRGGEKRRRWKG
jgi:hypothetical protein